MDAYIGKCVIVLAAALCLTGCLAEDRSECPVTKERPSVATAQLYVHLVMPDESWIEYQARSSDEIPCTIEIYNRQTNAMVCHLDTVAEPEAYGAYGLQLDLAQGQYQLLAWTSASQEEPMYDTSSLKAVSLLPVALNSDTHNWRARIAYCASMDIDVSDGECHVDANLMRPFAIYQLYIIDGDEYRELAPENGWPPLDCLGARVAYEGFYPTGINVATGNPNDAIAGVSYEIEVAFDQDEHVLVGEDAVLAHGDDSFVQATIIVYDKTTGEIVTTASGIKIPYREGCATTIQGAWLCSNQSQGGIGIDTSWNEVIIPF